MNYDGIMTRLIEKQSDCSAHLSLQGNKRQIVRKVQLFIYVRPERGSGFALSEIWTFELRSEPPRKSSLENLSNSRDDSKGTGPLFEPGALQDALGRVVEEDYFATDPDVVVKEST